MEPTITDWIMVVITAIYVIATICIMKSNKASADASKAQLEENREQFDEMRRLNSLPFLQIELNAKKEGPIECLLDLPINSDSHEKLYSYIGVLRNIGNGTAMNIVYSWHYKEKEITNIDCLSVNAIRYGDSYKVEILTDKINNDEKIEGTLTFSFQDLIGNEYDQTMFVTCQGYGMSIEIDMPKL